MEENVWKWIRNEKTLSPKHCNSIDDNSMAFSFHHPRTVIMFELNSCQFFVRFLKVVRLLMFPLSLFSSHRLILENKCGLYDIFASKRYHNIVLFKQTFLKNDGMYFSERSVIKNYKDDIT